MRFFFLALRGLVCCSILVFVAGTLTAEDRLANKLRADNADDIARQRERRFADARALADRDQWSEAIRAAQGALQLERQEHPRLETDAACTILQNLAVWQKLEGDYRGAAATYRDLLETCTKVFGPSHWLRAATQVDLDECQRDAQRSASDQRRLAEGNRLEMQALRLQAAGSYDLARESATKSLEIRQQIVAREDCCSSECLNSIGAAHFSMGKYRDAQPYIERSAAIRLRLYGLENPSTLATLQSLSTICMHLADYKQAQELLEKVLAGSSAIYGTDDPATLRASMQLGAFHMHRGNIAKAEPIMTAVLKKQVTLLGDKNLDVARTRMHIGQLYAHTGDARAAQHFKAAAASFREAGAGLSPDLATTLAGLGILEYARKDLDGAEQHFKESLDIFTKTVGESHPSAIDTLACLARVTKAKGDIGQAERLLRQALDLYVQSYGEQHQKTALVLTELGVIYQMLTNIDRAQACLERALKINRAILGDGHPNTIMTIVGLASQHALGARLDEAEKRYKEALALAEKNLGSDHEVTRAALYLLGNIYVVQRDYEKAEQTIRTLWESRKTKFPEQAHANAVVLESLVGVLIEKEDYQQAAELGKQVLEVYAQTLPKFDSGWASPLRNTATAYFALGRYDQAKPLVERAIELSQHRRHTASIAQSEAQQIAMSAQQRGATDLYLSLPDPAVSADEAYAQVLARKGTIHARQVRDSRRRGADLAPVVAKVQKISTQIATLSLKVPKPADRPAWLRQLRELRDRKSTLEAELAHSSRKALPAHEQVIKPNDVRSVLPRDAALVDVFLNHQISFDQQDGKPKLRRAQRFIAFVVRPGRPIQRIDLGEREPIEKAVRDWRNNNRYTADSSKAASAGVLRRLIWEPARPYLDGCTTVLFSPDGRLAGLPLGVLPGSRPGSFLLEDLSIAVVPVPQLLPQILASHAPAASAAAGPAGLLLIGDVDYDAPTPDSAKPKRDRIGDSGQTGGELMTFERLKSTGPEVQALASMYRQHFPQGKLVLLERAEATEAAFRREAPNHTCLLVATHGFYDPAGIHAALAAQNRPRDLAGNDGLEENFGALSGLALAGANLGATGDADDGILTSAEVWSLNLRNLDLAVLSGCETALGAVTDGEGALGLERAFQVAGARTTVSSLWNVPDGKTSQLMQRFHTNLWHKKMSKLEALRDAQLWMLRTGGKKPTLVKDASPPRCAPYYWAAFILSGDWR